MPLDTEDCLQLMFHGGLCLCQMVALGVKNPLASASNTGDAGSIPGLGRSPRGGVGNPLQYSCLENSSGGGIWWATVHGVAKSHMLLSVHTHHL